MTLVTLPSPIAYPGLGIVSAGPNVSTAATLDASGEYQAYIFSAKENMVVSHVGFRAGTATGSPTCTVSIETVDATGFPAGSDGFGSTSATTATITSNSWVLTALGASATISKGQMFAVKIAYASGTSQVIQRLDGILPAAANVLPYSVVNTGTPTKGAAGYTILLALGSNSTTFYQIPGAIAANSFTAGTFNNTNSAKRGLRFVPPMNCRAIGMRFYTGSTSGDYNISIMNDAGTELSSSSTAYDGDQTASGGSMTTAFFDNAVTLTAGTAYRIAIEPTSATNSGVTFYTLPSADYYTASPGGANATYATLASGTWTDSTTQVPIMDVLLDQIDDGTGSGSGGGQRVFGG